jgi:CheY-like chemotaxis protein
MSFAHHLVWWFGRVGAKLDACYRRCSAILTSGMTVQERRTGVLPERRAIPRGGRRPYDKPGQYPPILIADSYEAARTPCATYLHALRFEVAEAARPAEALALIDSGWVPHVILADSASADAVARHLTSSRHRVTPQLIIMTGSLEITQRPKSDLLVKPFLLKTMVQTVRRVLRRAARSGALADSIQRLG